MRERIDADAPVVDPEAETGDRSFGLEPRQRRYRAFHRLAEPLRLRIAMGIAPDVVDENIVDARNAETLTALVEAAQRAIE